MGFDWRAEVLVMKKQNKGRKRGEGGRKRRERREGKGEGFRLGCDELYRQIRCCLFDLFVIICKRLISSLFSVSVERGKE